MGTMVKTKAADGHELGVYRAEPAGAARGGLVVAQEIFGVNSHIRAVCDGYAADGYLVVAPALFDRVERGVELGYQSDDIARGRKLREPISLEQALMDMEAAAAEIAGAGRIGVVGYCWGGTIAWVAATRSRTLRRDRRLLRRRRAGSRRRAAELPGPAPFRRAGPVDPARRRREGQGGASGAAGVTSTRPGTASTATSAAPITPRARGWRARARSPFCASTSAEPRPIGPVATQRAARGLDAGGGAGVFQAQRTVRGQGELRERRHEGHRALDRRHGGRRARSGRHGDVFNPAVGEKAGRVAFASAAEVDAAVQAARGGAARAGPATTPLRRARIMFKLKDLLEQHIDELAELVSAEHGKTLADAKGSITRGIEVVEFACGIPSLLKGEFSEQRRHRRRPRSRSASRSGVCAGITPFNFPAMIPLWMFPMALACGNTFVLKPSEKDPSCPLRIAELAKEAGVPDGVLNVVNGDKEAVDAILAHPGHRRGQLRRLDPDRRVHLSPPAPRTASGCRRWAAPRTTWW